MAKSFYHRVRLWLCGAVAVLSLAPLVRAQYDPEWGRNFRLGAFMGFGIKANFKVNGNLALGGANPGPTGVTGASHTFDDGYVKPDNEGNENPDPVLGGFTSNFGYQNSGKVDPTT